MKTLGGLACPVLLLALAGAGHGGDEKGKLKAAVRAVLADHQDAVVSVKFAAFTAVEADGKTEKMDFKGEVTGTVLSPNGLTALCLRSASMNAVSLPDDPKQKTVFAEFELIFGDGRKLPAKIVSRDDDLGVVFIAPKEKQTGLKHVRFAKSKSPEILDRIIVMGRLGENLNRAPEVGVGYVSAILKKPHAAVVNTVDIDGGTAAFDETGRPIGVALVRKNGDTALRLIVVPPEALPIAKLDEAIKLWDKAEK